MNLVGVEGSNDVGMIEPAHQLHLALKPRHHAFVGAISGAMIFSATDPVHHCVMGFVDPAHRPRADPVEDHVTADDQPVRPVGQEPPGLERGQDLVAHQATRRARPSRCG